MHNRRRLSLLITASLLIVLGGTLRLSAQSAPPPLPLNLIGATELSDAQIAQLNAWVKHWADMLNAAIAPAEVERARAQLILPLNQPDPARMISPGFRRAYSQAATPELEKALAGGDLHRCVNALLVLSQLGDDRAITAILDQIDPQAQPRWQVRNAAASAARVLLQGSALDARKINATARSLRDAAMREENGLILRHLFSALGAADNPALPAAEREAVRQFMIEALGAVANRLPAQNDAAGPAVDAAAMAVGGLRDKFVQAKADRENMGPGLGPILGKLLAYAQAKWVEGHADAGATRRLAVLVGACETLLQVIDETIRQGQAKPPAELKNAWNSGSKDTFDAAVKAWLEVLANSPYKQ